MRETCYCGRTGEISDRDPVALGDGATGLACPSCGHTDRLEWLPDDARRLVLEEAARKHPKAA
jgi:hypothetical protein